MNRESARLRRMAARELAAREQLIAQADAALARALLYEEQAKILDGAGHRNRDQDTVTNVTPQQHGLATSKGRAKDALVKAANKKGHTLRSLAKQVGVSHSLISQARKGTKSIKRAVADAIATETGFAATGQHWPGGISDGE